MKTISAQRLFEGVNELWSGNSELPSTADFPSVRGHVDMALGEAWVYESWDQKWWPFLMRTERRYFRANWLAASTYNKTNEVFDAATQQYFQCLRNSVTGSGNSPTDSAGDERSAYWAECAAVYTGANWLTGTAYVVGDIRYYPVDNNYYQCHTAHTSSGTLIPTATGGDERWGVLTPFERYVDKEATGQTAIGNTYLVTTADPRSTAGYTDLTWEELNDRVYVRDEVAFCWISFRLARPRLTGTFFSTTATYAADAQVYYTTTAGVGNFYRCVTATSAGEDPDDTAAKWAVVEIPDAFAEFLIWSALAHVKTADDEAAARNDANAMAEGYLIQQANRFFPFRGTGSSAPPRVYSSSIQ
jgi:hypothetical protein